LAAGTNVVLNPSLETPSLTVPSLPANWNQGSWGNNQAAFTYPVPGFDGASAARVAITQYTDGDAKWYFDPVTVAAGDTYTFTDSYQSDVATHITLAYGMADGSTSYVDVAAPAASLTWAQATATFTAPPNAVSLTVFHLINQSGTLTIDNYSLSTVAPPPPPPPPPPPGSSNPIPNADLNAVSPTDPTSPVYWHRGGWGTNQATLDYPVPGPDGSNAAKITLSQFTNGDAKWYFDHVNVTAGDSYTFKDDYQSNVASNITVEYGMANGTMNYVDVAAPAASSTWAQATATFIVPANATSLTVFHSLSQVGSLTVDNYSLTKNVAPPPPPPPPPPGSSNLIPNADLSFASPTDPTSPVYWHKGGWGTSQKTDTYPIPGFNGTTGIQTQLTNYNNGDAKWYFDPVTVTANDNYQYSDYYKSDVPSVITVQYSMSDGTFTYADIAFPAAASDWTQVRATFSIPAGATGITIFHLINQTGTLATSHFALMLIPSIALPQGMVTLSFDDGYQSVYTNARPILDAAGYKPTLYINTGPDGLNNQPDYMTTAEVLSLYNTGYEVGAHTRTHPHLPTLTTAEQFAEIQGSKADLIALGMTPASTFAYPYGEYNDQVVQEVKDAGFIGARSVNEGFNNKASDRFLLMDQHVENTVTPDQIKAWIDQALLNRTWLILEMHDVVPNGDQYSNSPATLQAVVDYLKQKNVKVVTTAQGLQILNQ